MSPRRRKKKNKDLPDNLYADKKGAKVYYRYVRPTDKKVTYWGAVDRKKAIQAATKLNAHFFEQEDLIGDVVKSDTEYLFSSIIKRFETEVLPKKGYKEKTLAMKKSLLARISEGIGGEHIQHYTIKQLAEYLDTNFDADPYKRARGLLVEVYGFAKRKGIYTAKDNPAEETEAKSSKKKRQRLTLKDYKAIYERAPDWLCDAMDFALITLQARNEVVNAKYEHEWDECFHIIREKTREQTEKAFIEIPITPNLRKLIDRCRQRPIPSPFLIAYKPARRNRAQMEAKEHWTQVLPDYLSKAFAKARDDAGVCDNLPREQRPSFHEIRSLGGDLYLKQGYSKEHVNLLYGHTTIKMTEAYLKGHEPTWSKVEASLNLDTV